MAEWYIKMYEHEIIISARNGNRNDIISSDYFCLCDRNISLRKKLLLTGTPERVQTVWAKLSG